MWPCDFVQVLLVNFINRHFIARCNSISVGWFIQAWLSQQRHIGCQGEKKREIYETPPVDFRVFLFFFFSKDAQILKWIQRSKAWQRPRRMMRVLLFKKRRFRRTKHPIPKIRGPSSVALARRYERQKRKKKSQTKDAWRRGVNCLQMWWWGRRSFRTGAKEIKAGRCKARSFISAPWTETHRAQLELLML